MRGSLLILNTYTIADTLKFCPTVCCSGFTSRLLQVSNFSATLGLWTLFNGKVVELQISEASVGTFFDFTCNFCILLPSNQLLKPLARQLVVCFHTNLF